MAGQRIRVIIADDHDVVRVGLRAVLATASDMDVVGEAADGADAARLAEDPGADVVVMDLSMADVDGLSATRQIRARSPRTSVLIYTMYPEEKFLVQAFEAGASGYVLKSAPTDDLLAAIRSVALGDVYVRPTAAQLLAAGTRRSIDTSAGDRARLARLTERERTVLKLVAEGYSAPAIGKALSISSKTVDTYKQRINEKLACSGRPEYVRFALRVGLLGAGIPRASGALEPARPG